MKIKELISKSFALITAFSLCTTFFSDLAISSVYANGTSTPLPIAGGDIAKDDTRDEISEFPIESGSELVVNLPIESNPELVAELPIESSPELAAELPIESNPEPVTELPIESNPEPDAELPDEASPELVATLSIESIPELIAELPTEASPEPVATLSIESIPESVIEPTIESNPELVAELPIESNPEPVAELPTEASTSSSASEKSESSTNTTNSAKAATKLPAPTLQSIANTKTGVKVTWSAVSGAATYRVYRKTGSESWSFIGSTSATSFTDQTAVSGKTYTYTVYGLASSSTTPGSFDTAGISILYLSPILPANLTLVNGLQGAKVTWTKVTGASGYYVYRRTTTTTTYTRIATITSGSTLTYTDTTPASGTSYYYCVRAYNGSTRGAYEGKLLLYLDPVTADDLTLSNIAAGMKVSWERVNGAQGYYVYRRTPDGSYSRIGTVSGGSTLTYTDGTAVNGSTYMYCIRAYNGSTLGNYSGKTTVRVSTPTIIYLSNNADRQVFVRWLVNTQASGYVMQYSTKSNFSGDSEIFNIPFGSVSERDLTGLASGKTWYIRIRAYKRTENGNFYSSWSNVASITTTR